MKAEDQKPPLHATMPHIPGNIDDIPLLGKGDPKLTKFTLNQLGKPSFHYELENIFHWRTE